MARTPGTEAILEATGEWKDRSLLGGESALAPGRELWTSAHLEELHTHYVENPKLDSRHFLEKLEEQLGPTSPGAKQLAAEFIWVMMLFPMNFGPDTKRDKIRAVWEWSGDPVPDSPLMGAPMEKGIGSVGPGFINHQPFELKFLAVVLRELMSSSATERRALLEDPWALGEWLHEERDLGQRQLPHMLTHLLHPDHFERVSGVGHKRKILEGFGRWKQVASGSAVEVDRELLSLRRELEEEYPDRRYLDFYRPPLIERWQEPEIPEFEFIEENLERARKAFLSHFTDFKSFEEPGEAYYAEERGYKEDLRRRFLELVEDLPGASEVTEEEATRIVEGVHSLLTKKLEHSGHAQNLINWRYTRFLKELDPGERLVFARAFIELLDEDVASHARADGFVKEVWFLIEAHGAGGLAGSRSLPSLFLFLKDPTQDILIRTDTFNSLAARLTGERLFLNKRLDMQEYTKALTFAAAIRDELEAAGWKPRDMIDIQTFMFGADTLWDEVGPEGTKKEPAPGIKEPTAQYDPGTRDLSEIVQSLEDEGLHFPPELVANYVLALQTKRFVILTGISGTGKTKLAMRIGEFFAPGPDGEEAPTDPARQVQVVAVRPDWTDPRGLLGFYNPITEQYMGTGFLQLLLEARAEEEAARKEDRPARPYFAVLDEMNLARVEHYFSDFLSALESGRPLVLHHSTPQGSTGGEGSQAAQGVPAEIPVPRNIFFTGTVNVDETTHMFSPKVLDRAFTLELNEVDLDGWALGETESPDSKDHLQLSEIEGHLRWHGESGSEQWTEFGDLLEGRLRELVTGLNRALTPWGYHFGYRVAGEIARFVLLARQQGARSEDALWAALDLAVLQKVLPKFHGTEQELESPLRVVACVAHHGRAPTEDEIKGAQGDRDPEEAPAPRLPRCHRKVERMLRTLRLRGFAAFLE
jgi:5-methylcytosine-specific restriction enzyme B